MARIISMSTIGRALRARCFPLLIASALSVSGTATAEVVRSSEAGFTIQLDTNVPLPPPAAWAALTDVGKWWDPEHSYSGDSRNMTLDAIVGGCLCEKLGLYAGVQHMTVVYAQPPKILRLAGALGPLQEFAVTGSMTWTIEAAGGGSHIKMSYTAGGYADRPLTEWAPLVDSVLSNQMQRLNRFVSTGNPTDTKAEVKAEKVAPKPEPKVEPRTESKSGRKPTR